MYTLYVYASACSVHNIVVGRFLRAIYNYILILEDIILLAPRSVYVLSISRRTYSHIERDVISIAGLVFGEEMSQL